MIVAKNYFHDAHISFAVYCC